MHMYSYFANLYEIECVSQDYHRTLENISIWDITPLHMDGEISQGKKLAFGRLFQDRDLLDEVEEGFVEFSIATGRFGGVGDRGVKNPYNWWKTHGATCPFLQKLALRIISQVTSFSSCERNWSTYCNLYNLKKSRLNSPE